MGMRELAHSANVINIRHEAAYRGWDLSGTDSNPESREMSLASFELYTIPRHGRQRTGSVTFAAAGLNQALNFADQLAGDTPFELWQGERRLCRLQRSCRQPEDSAFWMVS